MTGVTEKLFMCQMFMCLFRPLKVGFVSLAGGGSEVGPEWVSGPQINPETCFRPTLGPLPANDEQPKGF